MVMKQRSVFRLLWRGPECHHRVCSLPSPWQQLWGLHLHHGESLPVRTSLVFGHSSELHSMSTLIIVIEQRKWLGVKWLFGINARKRDGKPTAVAVFHQVRGQQPGAAGGRRLHDRLSQRSNSPQEDAWHRLAEEMLPDDRQEVRMTQHFWHQTSFERKRNINVSWLVHANECHVNISHRLRKNLKCLIIVHPTWFIRTVLAISRPFIRWYQITSPA